ERIGFLCGIKQVIFNPNLHPELTMQGRIDRPEEYEDISTKCVEKFRAKNQGRCLVILSRQDEIHDNQKTAQELQDYYDIVWDDTQTHKFKKISHHLQAMKAFKAA
ncbi:YqiA/YcfP family alpha/beta fold hydrolase, partial [Vibrio cholerae]